MLTSTAIHRLDVLRNDWNNRWERTTIFLDEQLLFLFKLIFKFLFEILDFEVGFVEQLDLLSANFKFLSFFLIKLLLVF